MENAHQIGSTLIFKTQKGETLQGEITGRNWAFSYLLSYTVRHGARSYNVNANDLVAGHAF